MIVVHRQSPGLVPGRCCRSELLPGWENGGFPRNMAQRCNFAPGWGVESEHRVYFIPLVLLLRKN